MIVHNVSFMGSRNLINSYKKPGQCINEYLTEEGQKMTEIITDLGQGKNGVREIYKDALGIPNKVIDRVFGREETYTFENIKGVVQQKNEDGVLTELPANYWHYLTRV